ncbi:MAG: aminopeptidase P family protein [Kineothrix sp.]
MREKVRQRLESLRKEMEKEGVDFYLISSSDFHHSEYVHDHFKVRQYFSGFTGSNGTLVVGRDMAGLWTDGRYFVQAGKELEGTGITLFPMLEEGVPDIPQFLYENMQEGQTLGFDGRTVSCREGRRLEKKLAARKASVRFTLDLAERVWRDRPPLPCHEVSVLPVDISGRSTGDKVREVREGLQKAGADYLLLSRLDDLMWLLNIRGGDVSYNPVALCYGFLSPDRVYLFLQSGAVTKALEEHAEGNGVVIRDYHEIWDFLEHYAYSGRVLLDEGSISYALFQTVAGQTGYVNGSSPTELLKAVKNQTELAQMEEVYLRDSVQLIKFIYWLKQNIGKQEITEVSAAACLDGLRRGAEGFLDLSFPTICAYGENAAMMHYQALPESCKRLEPRGMLLVDSGGQYIGGTTDVTRTIVLGEISEEMKMHFTRTAVGLLQLSHARFLYGCTGRNLDILARQPLWEMGVDYKCGTGHGIGYMLNVHEGPQNIRWRYFPGAEEAVLRAGMVVSNEPGVYREGCYGIRTENIMAVREEEKNGDGQFMGFHTLTYVPIDREAIDTAYMQPIDVERLNGYHREVYRRTEKYLTEEERKWLSEVTAPLPCHLGQVPSSFGSQAGTGKKV